MNEDEAAVLATVRAAAILAIAFALAAAPLSAQAQGPSATVIGVVVDSLTGAAIGAARVSLAGGGPSVATNALGRFALSNVPLGPRRLVVSRLGYQDLEAVVQITDPMAGVRLMLSPDPVQLEGLSTRGAKSGDLIGRVVDGETGEPVPWAQISLTRDGVRKIGRRFRATDENGNFELPDIGVGPYVIRVDKPDYGPRLQQVVHVVPGPPVVITLNKDARRTAALAALTATLDLKLGAARKFEILGENRLQTARERVMDRFLIWEGPLGYGFDLTVDDGGFPRIRQGPAFFVDGIPAAAPLETYNPREFYRVDVLECPGSFKGSILLAYTYQYVEERLMNPGKRDPRSVMCTPDPPAAGTLRPVPPRR
jgi:hypothetical protein